MGIDYFDSRLLTGAIIKRPPQYSLMTDMFFKHLAPSRTDKFELQIKSRGRMLLPFVSYEEPGRVLAMGKGEVFLAVAPRIRVKALYKAAEILKNPIGYTPYDIVADPVERQIAEDLDYVREDADTTLEWMCASILTTGKLKVVEKIDGKEIVKYELDNQMSGTHKVTINTAGEKWSATGAKIIEKVEEWCTLVQDDSGYAPTELVLGKNVWGHFLRSVDVTGYLDNRRIDFGGLTPKVNQMFKGVWNGLNIWVYTGNVIDYSGNPQYLLDPDSILLGSRNADAVIEYGMPLDRKCEAPTTFFVKEYEEEDPSCSWLLCETRPMPWARRPDAFLCAKVL